MRRFFNTIMRVISSLEVWEVEDIGLISREKSPEKVDRTFRIIRQRTDALLRTLGLNRATTDLPKA